MATLSSPGIGSGLDVRGIVSQLMAVERQPLNALQTSTKRSQDQLSAYGKLSSAMGTLRDAARKLSDVPTWQATAVTSSKTEALSVTSDGKAPPGSYAINVTALAQAQTVRTNRSWPSGTENIGSGTLTIELGSWNAGQTAFTQKPGSNAVDISIPNGSDSLEQVRDAINAAAAGVTASIINDASGARLALRSTETGAANGFRVSVNDNDGDNGDAAGLSNLAYVGAGAGTQSPRVLAASNATVSINNVLVESTTNTLADVLDGLTLKLTQTTSAPVDVTVSRDTEAIKKQVTDFATAYNDLVKLMREQTRTATPGADGESSSNGGTLGTDASAKGLLNQLRTLAGSGSAASTAFARLADIGLEPQRDGSLKVNDNKLNAAVAKLDELKTFFTRNEAGSAEDGFGQLFKSFTDDRMASEGTLGARSTALQQRIDRNAEQKLRLEARLALTERRLTEQYGRLDTSVSRLNNLQSYVSQQIAAWNRG